MILKYILPLSVLFLGVICLPSGKHLLGAKECTWGPSYWCKNLTSAHGCNAVRHCISTVWEHMDVKEDKDDICSICKHMVVEARNQLESNETMEELKEVFDGSCKLMYVKPAVELCTKMADEMVPELVDAISSQMNPDIVCSVAGLCNNVEIDAALDEYHKKDSDSTPKNEDDANKKENCNTCGKLFNQTVANIDKSSSADLMEYLLNLCGRLSSFSDSCASIVLTNFEQFEMLIRSARNHNAFCYVSGSCRSTRQPVVGDETCDFCQQIVLHFKDMMTADTSEIEFKKVLKGICSQTKKFSEECNSIVDQYADMIYEMIAKDLDGKAVCSFFQLCPAPGSNIYYNGKFDSPLPAAPLPQRPTQESSVNVGEPAVKVRVVGKTTDERLSIVYGDPIAPIRLPEELYSGKSVSLHRDLEVNGQQSCVFCQYLLHYVQQVITQPYGEEAIKKVMDEVCDVLPKSVEVQCREFVGLYGDAFVAILAQEIDPSQVCPGLKVCPAKEVNDRYEADVLIGKPACPLCLMAIGELDEELTNNKTEASVRAALDKVCEKLPKSLVQQCDALVDQYTEQLVDMLIADFTPEEVCEYLKICKKPNSVEYVPIDHDDNEVDRVSYDVLTNEIPDFTSNGKLSQAAVESKPVTSSPGCIICEFIMEKLDELLKENKTQDDVDKILNGICNHLPRTIRKDCDQFIVKYGEEILNTLAQFVTPDEVCSAMGLCLKAAYKTAETMTKDCAMCEAVYEIRKLVIKGDHVLVDRANFLLDGCSHFPASRATECNRFIRRYGVPMFNAISDNVSTDVCADLGVCDKRQTARVQIQKRDHLIGGNPCTYGPSYWCVSRDHANQCGAGALKHCQDHVANF